MLPLLFDCPAKYILSKLSHATSHFISAGGKNLGFKNGRFLKFGKGNEDNQAGTGIVTDAGWRGKMEAEELPLSRLFVTVLQRMGVEATSFGGITGTLSRV